MTSTPFTVGLVQESVTDDVEANVDRAVERIHEAAGRGAQIICLQELFNAPYFCKAQRAERFDLAEPIPGPTGGRRHRDDLPAQERTDAVGRPLPPPPGYY